MPARAKRHATRGITRRQKPQKPKVTAITKAEPLSIPEAIEKVLILGDLSSLQPQERVDYYKRVCVSLGLNPLTMPFTYILFREFDAAPAKLSLYANKSCTEQLRKIHGVGVIPPLRKEIDTQRKVIIVEADVRDRTGKTDTATGVVSLVKFKDGRTYDLTDREYCNALMKCETKAKRRATLSICGLAFLDESELDTMQVVGGVTPDGRIFRYAEQPPDEPPPQLSERAPHGHPPGSAKAKQAEAQLAKVEAADREALGAQNAVPKAAIPQNEAKAAPVPPNTQGWPVLEAEAVSPHEFQVFGYVPELFEVMEQCCTVRDGFFYCSLAQIEKMRGMQEQYKFRVTVVPSRNPGAKGAPDTKPQSGSGKRGETQAAAPTVVSGVIEQVFTPQTKNPMRQVKILTSDKKKPTFGCFDTKLFPYLDKGKGLIEAYVTVSGKYMNLVGLKRIVTTEGLKEFDDDGHTPVVNVNREPGAKTLF